MKPTNLQTTDGCNLTPDHPSGTPTALRVHGCTRHILTAIVFLASAISLCAGELDALCKACGGSMSQVYFHLGDRSHSSGNSVCTYVLHIPCETTTTAFTFLISTNADCPVPFDEFIFADDITWYIDGDAHGMKLIAYPPRLDSPPSASAFLQPAGSIASVTEGAVKVVVEDRNGIKRSGVVTIKKDCDCEAGSSFGSASPSLSSVAVSFELGRYAFGKTAGAVAMREYQPTNLLCTPACLTYKFATNSECEVITNGCALRQVKVPEGLLNVVTNTAYKYTVEVWHPLNVGTNKDGNGLYPTNGLPLKTITVENPDGGSSTNRLKVTDGDGFISEFEWKTNGWQLVKGSGARKESKLINWTNSNTTRISTSEVRNENNALVMNRTRKYQVYDYGTNSLWTNYFGTNLIEEVVGDGGSALTNTWSYHTNSGDLKAGLLKEVVGANGTWESYSYETNRLKTNSLQVFMNQSPTNNPSLTRTFDYSYGSNAVAGAGDDGKRLPTEPRRIVENLLGHEVSRTYLIRKRGERRDIQCVTPGAAWTNADNLVTITRWHTNGPNGGRLASVERPDGTMDFRDYFFYTNSSGAKYRTNITLTGVPDGGKTTIVDGTRRIKVLGGVGEMVSITIIDIASGITNSHEAYSDYDSLNQPRKVTYLDGTYSWTDYGCCGPINQTNREGTLITHYRDPVKRQAATKSNGITITNILDADGKLLGKVRIGSDGSRNTNVVHTYDTAGRLLSTKDALGNITTYSEVITNYQLIRTTTYPDGATRIENHYRDGQLAKVTGTAVHPVRYDYGVEQDNGVWRAFTKEIKLDAGGNDTSEWTKTYRDMVGRSYKTVFSDGAMRESFYNTKGQLVKQLDPDGVTTLYAYNSQGELEVTATDMDRDGNIDYDGTDRIRKSVKSVEAVNGLNVSSGRSYAWAANNSAASNLVTESRVSTDGLQSWTIHHSQTTNHTRTKYAGSGNRYATNTAPDGSYAISHFTNGLLKSVTRKNASGTQLSQTTYFHDAHGRQYASTDARNGTTTFTFNNADQVVTTTTPPPGNGQSPQTTSYEHDWAGRITRTVLPDGTSVTNEYHLTGELKKTYGSRNYPVQYGYDPQGRRTNMITWKNFAADSGKATTVWKFDGNRGFLTNKVYDDGKGPFYAYTPAGRMRTRTWARGVVTTYHTNAAGEVFATTYSDSTPAVTNNFDRLGRPTNIVDGAGNRFLAYSDAGLLLSETNSSGTLLGGNLRFAYDQYLRRTNHQLFATNTSLLSHSFAFDDAFRITNVSDGTYQAGYSYLANSPLISQITYRSNSTTRMTTTKSYDFLNRLTSIGSVDSSLTPLTSYLYQYNDANQRTRVNMADGSFWIYEYDKLGQVISGKRYWSDWTPVAGQQYAYAFDDIGNRSSTKSGGDSGGTALRSASYTANALNQYTSRDVPAYLNVLGIAHANASVTVNGQSPYRRGEYFRQELSANNASAALWQSITNIASLSGTSQTNTGNLFLPKTAEGYTYDLDGNLTSDGRWTNRWDGENRLIQMEALSSVPDGAKKKLVFVYDSRSRRVSKTVSNWVSSAWQLATNHLFVYDGWNLIGVINPSGSLVQSFLWGLDLSGSPQGAGGVGGLLAVRDAANGSHFAAYDGNGNVMALMDGTTGNTSARYEYSPFGELIRCSGSAARFSPFRFSTKFHDEDSDFSYYGYRFFNPNYGQWVNRDPLGELGFELLRNNTATPPDDGASPYCFVNNDPANRLDGDGLVCVPPLPPVGATCLLSRTCSFASQTITALPPLPACGNRKLLVCNYTCTPATFIALTTGGCAAAALPVPPGIPSVYCVGCGTDAPTCPDEIQQYIYFNGAGAIVGSKRCITDVK